jgi:hypothetical protein
MNESAVTLPQGTRLRYRLTRQVSRGSQIGCFAVIFLVLSAVAALLLANAFARRPGQEGFWLLSLVGGGLALAALFMLFATVKEILALGTPETLVEIDSPSLMRGQPVTFFLRQTGRGLHGVIRINLFGQESTRAVDDWTHGESWTVDVFDSGPFEVDGATPFERVLTFDVPDGLEPSMEDGNRKVEWILEVKGDLRGRANFDHSYAVRVE